MELPRPLPYHTKYATDQGGQSAGGIVEICAMYMHRGLVVFFHSTPPAIFLNGNILLIYAYNIIILLEMLLGMLFYFVS